MRSLSQHDGAPVGLGQSIVPVRAYNRQHSGVSPVDIPIQPKSAREVDRVTPTPSTFASVGMERELYLGLNKPCVCSIMGKQPLLGRDIEDWLSACVPCHKHPRTVPGRQR